MTDLVDMNEQCPTCAKNYNVTPDGTVTHIAKRRVALKNVFDIATGRRLVVDRS
jgi:hypothetical protein